MQNEGARSRRELEATSSILHPIVKDEPKDNPADQKNDLDSMRERLADMERRAKERTQKREASRVSDMRARLAEMEARARQRSEIWESVAAPPPRKPEPSPPQPHRPQQLSRIPDVEPLKAAPAHRQPTRPPAKPPQVQLGQYPARASRRLERPPPPPNKAAFKAQLSRTPKRLGAPFHSPGLSQPSLSLSTASDRTLDDDTPVKATLTMKQSFTMNVDSDERANFESGFMDELASFLGVDQSRVKILSVRERSN